MSLTNGRPRRKVPLVEALFWLFSPLLLVGVMLLLIASGLLGCANPTAPAAGVQRLGVRCVVTRVNDSTLTDRCR